MIDLIILEFCKGMNFLLPLLGILGMYYIIKYYRGEQK